MDVIIVSKTHMSNAACVGGVFANGRLVRLLTEDGHNQDSETNLKVGDVYTVEFQERSNNRPPHVEDILVTKMKFKFSFSSIDSMVSYLKEKLNVNIWEGGPDVLFDGKLQWTDSGSGYISENGEIPNHSVGFWIPDKNLTKRIVYEKVRYNYPNINGWHSLPFVGFDEPIDTVPSGTLTRVSLARWWDRNGETEDRCSLQLSGWYEL
jgi:hypothetical protein